MEFDLGSDMEFELGSDLGSESDRLICYRYGVRTKLCYRSEVLKFELKYSRRTIITD